MSRRYDVIMGGETTIAHTEGLVLIKNASNSTDYDVVLLDYSGKSTVLHHNSDNFTSYGEVVEGKVCVLKENGNYIIKNRWTASSTIVVVSL